MLTYTIWWFIMLKFEFKKISMRTLFLAIFLLLIQAVTIWSIETPEANKLKNLPESITSEDIRKFDIFSDYLTRIKIDSTIPSEEYFAEEGFLESYNHYTENDYKPLIIKRENYREAIVNYDIYVEKVIETSGVQGLTSVQKYYSNLSDLNLKPLNYHPVEAFIRNSTPQLFVLIFAVFLGVNVSSSDVENTDFNLTNVNGDKNLSFTKILASIIAVVSFTVLSSILNWLLPIIIYGNVSLFAPIQAFPSLMQSPFSWLVVQWLIMVTLWNSLGAIVIVLMTLLIFRVTKQAVIASGIIWFILVILYQVVHPKSIFSIIRYFNPINLLESTNIFSRYTDLLFGLSNSELTLIIGIVLVVLLGLLYIILPQQRNKKSTHSIKTSIYNHTSMFKHTVQKLFINHKSAFGVLLLILVVTFQSYNLIKISYTPAFKEMIIREQQVFANFNLEELEKQVNIYEDESKEINIMLQQGKDEENLAKALILYEKNESARRTYIKVLNYMNLGYDSHPSGYEVIMSKYDQTNDMVMSLLSVLAVVLMLSPLFASNDEYNDTDLYKTTPNYQKQINSNIIVGLILVLLIYIIIYVSRGVILSNNFYFQNTSVKHFLWSDSKFSINQSTSHYIAMLFISRFIGINLVCLVTFIIAKFTKSIWQTILGSLAFILWPIIISVSLNVSTSYISIFDLLLGNDFLNRSNWFQKIPLISIIVLIFLYKMKQKERT